jgi:phospholipid/cholesterol/gamma-HCH transport system substrate-binding protein
MSRNIVETLLGLVVFLVAIGFLVFAYHSGSIEKDYDGLRVFAVFSKVDGIATGSDVRISGVKIGKVSSLKIDPESFNAVVELSVDKRFEIPSDSSAEIISGSLLGDKYISITPGASEDHLKNGGRIAYTQPSVNIESLIAKFMFGSATEKQK